MGGHRDLIVAWGNPDRRDDAAGLAVAEGLRRRAGGHEAVQVFHQLPPELAEDLSRVDRVLFIDASVDTGDEDVTLREILPATSSHADISHHLPPERLLGLADAVYGRSPKAWLLTVRAHDTDFGKALSPHTARLIERAIEVSVEWVETGER